MTLHAFLELIAHVPAAALRRAITSALAVERPASPESFGRFYQRVVSALDPIPEDHAGDDRQGGVRAA